MVHEMCGYVFLEILSHKLYLLKVISQLTKSIHFIYRIIVPIEGTIAEGI